MKKLLISGSIVALLLPGLAFAAYSDVSMDTTVVLTVNGITLNLSGSGATIQSLVINPTNFQIAIRNGSIFQVTAPGRERMSADTGEGQNINTCNSTESVLGYNLSGTTETITVTVAPTTTLCADPTETGSTSKSDSTGGGGGGGATAVAKPVAVAAQATYATKEAHIQAIMQAIAVLQAQMQALTGAPAAQVSAISGKITANLSVGSRGSSVKVLQQFLNTHGFTVASTGAGSPGKETETFGSLTVKAVQKFQEQYNIAKPGVPGYGTVGPKTRAKINELSGN